MDADCERLALATTVEATGMAGLTALSCQAEINNQVP